MEQMRKLRAGDVDAFMEHLRVFFSGIPYELSDNTERHYQAIFYVVFTLLGQFCRDGSAQRPRPCRCRGEGRSELQQGDKERGEVSGGGLIHINAVARASTILCVGKFCNFISWHYLCAH